MEGTKHLPFVEQLVQLCAQGCARDWHERNGGNLSYRLSEQEIAAARVEFTQVESAWVPLGETLPGLAGQYFAVTASGSFFSHLAQAQTLAQVQANAGIIALDGQGAAYKTVWGFANGANPTSELMSHLLVHQELVCAAGWPDACADQNAGEGAGENAAARLGENTGENAAPLPGADDAGSHGANAAARAGAAQENRVVYHCHPASIVALTSVLSPDARIISNALWRTMTECITVFPEGVGVVPFLVPGSVELGRATAQLARTFRAVVWEHHGLLAMGDTFDNTFELAHVVAKAADLYLTARAAAGATQQVRELSTEQLASIARFWHLDAPLLADASEHAES